MISSDFTKGPRLGIAGMAYTLPDGSASLEELDASGRLSSPASLLASYGFEHCRVTLDAARRPDLLSQSAELALAASQRLPEQIDRLLLYSGIEAGESGERANTLSLFRYEVAELQHRLKLSNASAIGLSQQGCSGLLTAVDLACTFLAGRPDARGGSILCVAGDFLPAWAKREILYNVISDATAALVVSDDFASNRILSFTQQVQSYYWDTPLHEAELIASYFPIAQRLIAAALKGAGLQASQLRWVVPHNVSLRSWEILAKLLAIPLEKVWTANIARLGHTISCDHIINLADMTSAGALDPGDYLLLFTFGFGATWSALVIQH
jgi:3-oxoacyl-[acyl-carrier-protein] synthase-3